MLKFNLLESGLNEVRLVDESLLEVGQTVLLQLVGLLARQLLGVADLRQERSEVVQLEVGASLALFLLKPLLRSSAQLC